MTWRFHLQSLPSRTWIDRDVPLQNASVTRSVSGPAAISGYLPGEYANRDAVQEWGAMLIAEQPGSEPVACIVDQVTTAGTRLKVEAGGFSMYPKGMPWTAEDYASTWIDPLVVLRFIWATLQAQPGGNLGVVLDDTVSPVRLGIPERADLTAAKQAVTAATTAEASAKSAHTAQAKAKEQARVAVLATCGRPASGVLIVSSSAPSGTRRSTKNLWLDSNNGNKGYVWNGKKWVAQTVASQTTINNALANYNTQTALTVTSNNAWTLRKKELAAAKARKSAINGGDAVPYTLQWWDTHDLGTVQDTLAKDTPFDYRERSTWVGDDITHRLELGTPALGGRRPDLRFEVGVNVTAPPPLLERDYASEVEVLGAGTGRAMVRASVTGNPGRLRRAVVIQRSDLNKTDRAAAVARGEIAKRSAAWVFDTLAVTDHELAPYGSYLPGDIIYVTGDAGWKRLDQWVRVLDITDDCVTGAINLKVEAA